MGGNAIKTVALRRLKAGEIEPYTESVILKLKESPLFQGKSIAAAKYYRTKETFGDLDLIVSGPKPQRDHLDDMLQYVFQTKEIYHNSDVVSFEHKNFQVDLIFVPEIFFESACFYYSYNDLNNLTGRIAHKLGLKFGWDGLWLPLRTFVADSPKKIFVSSDPAEIYGCLGYDINVFNNGFDTVEDIFRFAVSTPYFSSEIFAFENLNHINRLRHRKRTVHNQFVKWLEEHRGEYTDEFQFAVDKSFYLPMINDFFPEAMIEQRIAEELLATESKRMLADKINGRVVMRVLGISGSPIVGKIVSSIKDSYADGWLMSLSDEALEKLIILCSRSLSET